MTELSVMPVNCKVLQRTLKALPGWANGTPQRDAPPGGFRISRYP